MKLDPNSRTLVACLWVAFMLLIVMATLTNVRIVKAEDDCADPTWRVQRTPIGLLCIVEGGP